MKNFLLLFVAVLCTLHASSQANPKSLIKGRILDKETHGPLSGASVALLHAKDSSSAALTFTDKNGIFAFDSLPVGNYKLYVTYLGYQPLLSPAQIRIEERITDLGTIVMQRTGLTLAQVEIVETKPPMALKKDTVEFSAGYYKTRENAVIEDLLKKLPGVQVDRDGTIRVNGEVVKMVLVDGRPFFGNDPKLATRNLLAEMIDKVQLIDRKPEKEGYSGNNDSRTEKAINITIKKEKKNTFSGQVTAGYGTDGRFAGNGSLNRFRDHQQLSFLGSGNNTNGYQGGKDVSDGIGVTRNWNGGVNYSEDIGKKLIISGSYFIDNNHIENQRNSARQNMLKDSTNYYNQQSQTQDNNTSYRMDLHIDYKIDSLHTLSVINRFNYVNSSSLQYNMYKSLGSKLQLLNEGTIHNVNMGSVFDFSGNMSFEKKFKKTGRMLNIALIYGYGNNDRKNYNISNNLFVQPNAEIYRDSINQHNVFNGRNGVLQLFLAYTEPIFKDRFLDILYVHTRFNTSSNKLAYDYTPSKGVYDHLNDSLSNSFENITASHFAGINIRTQKQKYDYTFGLNMLVNDMDNTNISQHSYLQQGTTNFYPTASFNYAFTNSKRLRFFYSAGIETPSANQLQPVPDNSNPLYVQLGNPNLKPALTDNFALGYNAFNAHSLRSFSANMNVGFTHNRIINANWFDSLGRQVSQPLNMNGAYNISFIMVNSFPLKKQQTAINANTAFNLIHDVSYINGILGNTSNMSISQGLSFNYVYKELFDFSTAASANYNRVQYSVQKDNNTNYFNYNFSLDCNVNLPLGFIIGGNLNYMLNTGRAAGYNLDVLMLNASVSKTIFRHRQGLVKLQGFDLLNRNVSISRNIGVSYIEDVQTRVLQRFFMVSFSYFLKKRDKKIVD
ncbi:carboxypeptidase family protein [Chitinophaga niastensis]|uniref:Carboxypeptidase family protein n=1 Tax=Chitinophaga niastensis TaxID=536980 RepID=A0A2P8HQ90_CHINA|nr:TonB-dependent receptor [Chitinophaga niastensis]PSL48365.1 carboxypeptidase family protein [Chitinophaga niastensis]